MPYTADDFIIDFTTRNLHKLSVKDWIKGLSLDKRFEGLSLKVWLQRLLLDEVFGSMSVSDIKAYAEKKGWDIEFDETEEVVTPRLYRYVGSATIAKRGLLQPPGWKISSAADLRAWLSMTGQTPRGGLLITTFVVNKLGELLVSDRHSEHVGCASGGLVQTAGELIWQLAGDLVRIVSASNQSTGYCPEPASWVALEQALEQADLEFLEERPSGFDPAYEFRRCPQCGLINLIKQDWYECSVCEASLPLTWNCDEFRPLES